MKALFALLFIFPAIALAAGYGGASGTNSHGEIIRIEGDIPETIYVQKDIKDFKWKEKYSLLKECPNFPATTDAKEFSCSKTGESPLAGTTYKITTQRSYKPCNVTPYNDKSPGEVYVCIRGCENLRAPKTFYVSPWECG